MKMLKTPLMILITVILLIPVTASLLSAVLRVDVNESFECWCRSDNPSNTPATIPGGKDGHGCIPGAGQTWNSTAGRCQALDGTLLWELTRNKFEFRRQGKLKEISGELCLQSARSRDVQRVHHERIWENTNPDIVCFVYDHKCSTVHRCSNILQFYQILSLILLSRMPGSERPDTLCDTFGAST